MKKFATKLEYVGSFKVRPGDGAIKTTANAAERAIGGVLKKSGWSVGAVHVEGTENIGEYKLSIGVARRSGREFREEMVTQQLAGIYDRLGGSLPGWKRISHIQNTPTSDSDEQPISELLAFQDDWKDSFSHIYDRDLQISEMMNSIALARDTELEVRNHVLLYGEPSVGKSEICLVLSQLFSDTAVKRLDATSTTRAGAIDFFLKVDRIPPVVVIEEIDKVVNQENLSWFLSVMDGRGDITKTTARSGSISRAVRPLVIATINNIDKVRSFHDGALLSRFVVQLYCPLATDDIIKRVLLDHIHSIPGGKEEWVQPTLEYAQKLKIHHIRQIKAIMTTGKDRLLDGSYQRDHFALIERERQDKEGFLNK